MRKPDPTSQSYEPLGPGGGQEISSAPTEPQSAQGCGRPAMIGCGVVLVVLAAVAVLLYFRAEDLLLWSLDRAESEIEARIPEEIDEEERERLAAGFEGLRDRVQEGNLDPEALQPFQVEMRRLLQLSPEEVTAEDIRRLIEAVEEAAAARRAPSREEEPQPAPNEPEPQPEDAGSPSAVGQGAR